MYKKLMIISVCLLSIGCAKEQKEVIRSEFACHTDDSSFTLVVENGQIVNYIDSVDGDLGGETVDILNSEHLIGITDNNEALSIMDAALKDLNGACEAK